MLHLLLPTACGACGRPGPSPCPACWAQLRPAAPAPAPAGLAHLVALLDYDGPARELVARLKYRNRRAVLAWLADGLAATLRADRRVDVGALSVVTWSPTTPARRRERGFDQSELLARAVARRLDLPVEQVLGRDDGPPQTGRSGEDRRRRPTAFHRLPAARLRPSARVLLLDDVVTTGATLTAAAGVLASTGATEVIGAVAARTGHHGRR